MAKLTFLACHFTHNNQPYCLMVENARENYGHDDSFCFQCDWSVVDLNNNCKVILKGKAWNDGWGGPNECSCSDFDKYREFNEAVKECYTFTPKGYDFVMDNDIADLCSELTYRFINGHRGAITQEKMLALISA